MKCPPIDVGMAMADYTATIRVTGYERFKVRIWLATQILWLGMWVAGCRVKIAIEIEKQAG